MVWINIRKLTNASFACEFRLQKIIFIYLLASENKLKNNYLQKFSLQVSLAGMQTLFCVYKESNFLTIKKTKDMAKAKIYYHDIGDYLSREKS